ncbi:TPA: 30S ribosomal protein S5, partial [Candidatus Micrarchaeota archaeon]|nr:30S ribosomal protein S5 [Candidatus Micrarchaeota archaeon]
IKSIDEILNKGLRIQEPEIVDILVPNLKVEMVLIGQGRGKFSSGKRKVFRVTKKMTREGKVQRYSAMAIVGNEDGYVGIGFAHGKENLIAKQKAIRKAKLNLIKIARGCGSWECRCKTPHSIPFKIRGKEGSVEIVLFPAPKGTGLVVEEEAKKLLRLAGIKDIHSFTRGQTRTKFNTIYATFYALKQLTKTKITKDFKEFSGYREGSYETPTTIEENKE